MDRRMVHVWVNGMEHRLRVTPRQTLADLLREPLPDGLALTGTHLGCEHGFCGACTVLLDGEPVRACLVLGVQVDGHHVTTVEGLAAGPALSQLQAAFCAHRALQCGFCTPGLLITATALLEDGGDLDEECVRTVLGGNLCRCTGYAGIVQAILAVAAQGRATTRESHQAGAGLEAERNS